MLEAARLQAPDPVLVALLQSDHGRTTAEAEAEIEAGYDEVVAHRRVGQLDLIRYAQAVVRNDPASPPAVSLLRVLLTNHLGWSAGGIDRDMRRLMRQLERMSPAERAEVLATAAEIEGRA
ncbi:MAG: hypothetical protein KC501_41055 [Myxococcales bacterium]|nr:hypothetical protein [Myxococcales bacterium]